jgi:DNA-binding XRE family transcriptional regulator
MSSEFMNKRKSLGLTQRQIAETIGVTVQTVSNWETGTYQPKLTIEQTEKLCDVLQTDIKGLRIMFEVHNPLRSN